MTDVPDCSVSSTMENSDVSNTATDAVSRSRGKQPGEPGLVARMRERRKADGKALPTSQRPKMSLLQVGPQDMLILCYRCSFSQRAGAVVLHKLFNRSVVLYPDNTVVKSGHRIMVGEAEALKTAARAGVPVPVVHEASTASNGRVNIRMDYIPGESLEKLWPAMSADEKMNIAHQHGKSSRK